MGLQMKAHKVRVLDAWPYTEQFNFSVSPRKEQNLNSTR